MTLLSQLTPDQQAQLSAAVSASPGDAVARSGTSLFGSAGPRLAGSILTLGRLLPRTAAMLANVRGGFANGAIAIQEDSTGFSTNVVNRKFGYNYQMASILTSAGIPADTNSIWGFSTLSAAALQAWDSRIVLRGGTVGGLVSLGGGMFKMTASGDGLDFTPDNPVAWDTCEISYPADGQFGQFSVQIDNSTPFNVNQNTYGATANIVGGTAAVTGSTGTDGRFGRITVKIDSIGAHTLKLLWVANGTGGTTAGVSIAGIRCYNSAIKSVSIYNWGRPGETSVGWASGGSIWNWMRANATGKGPAQLMPIDLVLLGLGINDANTGVTPATYNTNMQSLITQSQTNNHDIALIVPVPTRTSNIPLATQQAIRAQIELLSVANNVPIIADMPTRWNEYDGGNALGYYTSGATAGDGIHPGSVGYADKAQAVIRGILSI